MRETYVTVLGNVMDTPRVVETANGTVLTKFRLASAPSTLRDGQWERGTHQLLRGDLLQEARRERSRARWRRGTA